MVPTFKVLPMNFMQSTKCFNPHHKWQQYRISWPLKDAKGNSFLHMDLTSEDYGSSSEIYVVSSAKYIRFSGCHFRGSVQFTCWDRGLSKLQTLVCLMWWSFNPTYLSPRHFLIREPLKQLAATEFTNVNCNRLSMWQTYQQHLQPFWQRWSSDYLQSLKQRQRCQRTTSNLQPGDLVLLREDKTAPLHWPTAVIIDIHPGKNAIVRVVTIRTPKGLFKRPIIKICPLTCVNSELKCNYFWGWQYVTLRTEFFVSISFVSSDRTTRDRVAWRNHHELCTVIALCSV